jgi:autoinducer 2 (AI-2) kinase
MMNNARLLAIDAGTGSIRAVLFDLHGNQVGSYQREWEHAEDPRYPGSMDFDWNHNWDLAKECIQNVIAKTKTDPTSIVAVSTTCMREGIVLYDAEGNEIWACANVDARSSDEVAYLVQKDPLLEQEIYRLSGQTYALGALPRLLWVKNKLPELYEKVAKISMFNDWLIYRLTGVLATEPSNGSTTGIFDLSQRNWDASIAERIGLKTDIFPPVAECGSKVGEVHQKAAQETGLAEGTVVIAGGGDAQMGCVGVGVVKPNQAAVFGGSFWQYEFNTASGKTDEHCRVRVNCHGIPDVWQYEAIAFKPGLSMRWFRDAFCAEEIRLATEQGTDPYVLLDAKAAEIPAGSYGMLFTSSDVMNFIAWKHAAPTFTDFAFDASKYSKYTFYRAIMENTALVTRGHLDLVEQATGNRPDEIIFGGGAAKSPLWCQILSDVLDLPVKVPVVKEATALGTAILAGYGVGIYSDIATAAESVIVWDTTYTPQKENYEVYDQLYKKWRTVYDAQLALSDNHTTRYMWAAPGL